MLSAEPSFVGPFRIRDVRYVQGESQGRHGHDESQLSVILRGPMHEETGGVSYDGCVGDIVIKPAGLMHANLFGETRIICIDAAPADVGAPFDRYSWHRAPVASAVAIRLARRFLAGTAEVDDVDDVLGAIPSRITSNRAVAARAARTLDETFAAPPTVEQLATDLGIHRVHLARVFRLQWQCTPREYIQQLRVRAAAHALASTTHALAEIALDTGFSDQAHMSRMFLRRMGMTPAAFRRLARA